MVAANSHCYYPDGTVVPEDSPCFPDEEASPCCNRNNSEWTCLLNGLCYDPSSGLLVRGSCTDHTWASPLCPQFCTKNDFSGKDARDLGNTSVTLWGCSDKWPGEGGLMCCETIDDNPKFNRSCCSGPNASNLLSIGSKLGTAKSITLSSPSSPETSSASPSETLSSAQPQASSPPFTRLILSNSIIYVDGSSFSALFLTTAQSTIDSISTILSRNPSTSLSSSFGSKLNSTTTAASSRSGTNGSTVPITVGTSIGAFVLIIIASTLVYRYLGRKGRKAPRNQAEDSGNRTVDYYKPEEIHGPQEMSGYQDHELSASLRYLTQELPQPANKIQNPQDLSSRYFHELQTGA